MAKPAAFCRDLRTGEYRLVHPGSRLTWKATNKQGTKTERFPVEVVKVGRRKIRVRMKMEDGDDTLFWLRKDVLYFPVLQ